MMRKITLALAFWENKWKKFFSIVNYSMGTKSFGLLLGGLILIMNCEYNSSMKLVPPTSLETTSTLFKIGGTASEHNISGLILQNNGGDDLEVASGATTFTFSKSVSQGSTYNVTVKTAPSLVSSTSGACNITNGSGTATADVTSTSVECYCGTPVTYSWGTFKDRCNGIIELRSVAGTFGGSEYEAQTLFYAKCSQGQTWNSSTNGCDSAASTIAYCGSTDNTCNGNNTSGTLASSTAFSSCNALNTTPTGGFGSKTTWRVPTRNELKLLTLCTGGTSIPNNGAACTASANPAIDGLFPSTPASASYWSSNSSTSANAWSVSFTDGNTTAVAKTTTSRLRCVTNQTDNYPPVVGKFRAITSTSNGDAVYAVGYFEGVGTFSFGNNVSVTGLSGTPNPVIVKYNSSGVVQWAKTYSSVPTSGTGDFVAVAVDSSGNVYAAGNTGGAAGSFGFGNSISINAVGAAFSSILVKYNSSGTPLLADSPTGSNGSYWRGLAVRGTDLYAAGGMAGNAPFTFGGYSVTGQNSGGTGMVIKYNTSNFTASLGQLATNGGQGCCAYNGVAVDSSGNVYLTGAISVSTVDFGNGVPPITGDVTNDSGMVVKLNSSFTAQWAKNFLLQTFGIALDSSNNVYITTRVDATPRDFSGVTYTGTSGGGNAVLVKLNGSTGAGVWVRGNTNANQTGYTSGNIFSVVSVDSSDNIYTTGWGFLNTAINFGSGDVTGGANNFNAFLLRYNTSGTVNSTTIQTSASTPSMGLGVFANSSGVYISGYGTESVKYTIGTKTFTGRSTGENPSWWK